MTTSHDGNTGPAPSAAYEPPDAHQPPQTLSWTDAQGTDWTIHADPQQLQFISAAEQFTLDRPQWRRAISFQPRGGQVVIHVDTGAREVGFMTPIDEARRLFEAMGARQTPSNEVRKARPVESGQSVAADPLWPKMTKLPLAALLLGALAFVPFAGILFGAAALVCGAIALKRAPKNAAHRHVRTVAQIGVASAALGLAIGVFGAYTMVAVADHSAEMEAMKVTGLEWGWGARVAALIMLLIAVSVHEAAHAITAWWSGDGYAKSLGRVTLNPLAHIDPFGTILLPILLMMFHMPVFGYARPVPVRLAGVARFRRAHIFISAAGPISNLLQAAWFMALLTLLGAVLTMMPGASVAHLADFEPVVRIEGVAGAQILAAAALMLKLGVGINVLLAVLNLIPIPPLDGSWILEHLFPRTVGALYARLRPFGLLVFAAVIFLPGNFFVYLMMPAVYLIFCCQALLYLVTGY